MPLNQKGSRVFEGTGSGYTEEYLNRRIAKQKPLTYTERMARRKFEKNRERHKVSSRAAFKLRSPRI